MTQNQIRYLQAMEEARANRAKEEENYRSNIARETETNRANLENERMAREKWDYEKYGKGGSNAGGVIRTIKAGVNDISKLIDATGDAINEAQSTKTPNEMLGTKQTDGSTSVDYGGIDVHKEATKASKSLNPYRNYNMDQLKSELRQLQSEDYNPNKQISSADKLGIPVATKIGQITDLINKKEAQIKQVQEKGKKKQAKLLGI